MLKCCTKATQIIAHSKVSSSKSQACSARRIVLPESNDQPVARERGITGSVVDRPWFAGDWVSTVSQQPDVLVSPFGSASSALVLHIAVTGRFLPTLIAGSVFVRNDEGV